MIWTQLEQELHSTRAELYRTTEDNKTLRRTGGKARICTKCGGGFSGDEAGPPLSPHPGSPRRQRAQTAAALDSTEGLGGSELVDKLRDNVSALNQENAALTAELDQAEASIMARDTRVS